MTRLVALGAAATVLAAACAANEAPPPVPVQARGDLVTQVPDSLFDAGRGSSVDLDQSGNTVVSYLLLRPRLKKGELPPPVIAGDPQPPAVMLASEEDGVWTRTSVTPQSTRPAKGDAEGISNEDGTAGPTVNSSLAVDAQDKHHVAWSSSGGLFYSTDAAGTFGDPQQVVKGSTLSAALALGSGGTPWVAFYQGSKLQASHQDGGKWSTETVAAQVSPGSPPAADTAIAVTPGGDPVVAYGGGGQTFLARRSGGSWNVQAVPGDGGLGVSMALDADGNPHLAYYDASGGVHHARSVGGGPWEVSDVASTRSGRAGGDPRWGTGIGLDGLGTPHLTWVDVGRDEMMLATASGGRFNARPVPNSQAGADPSLAVGEDGTSLAVSFFDSQNANLEVATPAGGRLSLAFSPPATTQAPPGQAPPAGECQPDGTDLQVTAPPGASGSGFGKTCLAAPAGEAFTVVFDNKDQTLHNWALYQEDPSANPAAELLGGAEPSQLVDPGQTATYEVDPIDAGTYFFRCDVHPTTMTGSFVAA